MGNKSGRRGHASSYSSDGSMSSTSRYRHSTPRQESLARFRSLPELADTQDDMKASLDGPVKGRPTGKAKNIAENTIPSSPSTPQRSPTRLKPSESFWRTLTEVNNAAVDSMSRENDGLLSLVSQEDSNNVKMAVAKVTSWYDFAQIFSDFEIFLQNLPLPAQRLPTLEQAIVDIDREKFTLLFEKGVPRERKRSVTNMQGKRSKHHIASASPRKFADEELEVDVASKPWHEVHQKIADALGTFTNNEPAVLDIIRRSVSRTLGGGDAFFVCQEFFSTDQLLVTPSHTESPGDIQIIFFHNGIVSIRTTSVFDIRSVSHMDGKEMVEVHATHVLNLAISAPSTSNEHEEDVSACSVIRHLLIDSPDSQVAADVNDLMGL